MTPPTSELASPTVKSRVDARERLIVALDVPSAQKAKEIVARLDGVVSFFKIGMELSVATGPSLISELTRSGKRIFLDLKFFDVPETVKRAVANAASLGVTFLTIHGNAKIVRAAVEGRGDSSLKLLAVTVLTSLDHDDIKELGFECSLPELVLYRARKALEAGCDGVITSPNEAAEIRSLAREVKGRGGEKFLVVTPGIRPQSSESNDQKRFGAPGIAIADGADYLVVGRPIREAADPRLAAEGIIAEMQGAFDSRQATVNI